MNSQIIVHLKIENIGQFSLIFLHIMCLGYQLKPRQSVLFPRSLYWWDDGLSSSSVGFDISLVKEILQYPPLPYRVIDQELL